MTTVPGAYFSPLTSPALNAQNYPYAQTHSSHYGTTSGSSTGASPIDVDMDMLDEPALSHSNQGRKLRSATKRSAPTRFNATPARVRQSPIVKPGRRKATVSSLIPPKEVSDLLEEERAIRPSTSGTDLRRSRESSESDSISPGPLSEMGPPPKPSSVHPSPAISPGNAQPSSGIAPATPASLMRIHPSPTFGHDDALPALDDLALPEASLDRPQLSRIDTAIQDGDQDTPRLSARKTPKLGPLHTPSGASAMSGKPSPSPMLSAVNSPTSPAFFSGTGRKGDPTSARSTKKRNSVTSTLVSPALRPKISPSIKPLLPDGCKFCHLDDSSAYANVEKPSQTKPTPYSSPPSPTTKTSSTAPSSRAYPTQPPSPQTSPPNAPRTKSPSRAAATASTRPSWKCKPSSPRRTSAPRRARAPKA